MISIRAATTRTSFISANVLPLVCIAISAPRLCAKAARRQSIPVGRPLNPDARDVVAFTTQGKLARSHGQSNRTSWRSCCIVTARRALPMNLAGRFRRRFSMRCCGICAASSFMTASARSSHERHYRI